MQKAKVVNNKLRYIQHNDTRISNVTLVKDNGRCNAKQCNAISKKVQRTPFEAETLALQGILCLQHS